MQLFEPLTIGLSQLLTNKLRSTLSLIGILIAVGSVTGIVSIGEGLQNAIESEFEEIGGHSKIWSWHQNGYYDEQKKMWIRYKSDEHLTNDDVEAIRASTDKIEYIIPNVSLPNNSQESNIKHKSVATYAELSSTSPDFPFSENWYVAKGRFFNAIDLINKARVCVLGSRTAEDLFGTGNNPLEQEVRIGGMRYTVIGVMEEKEFFDNNFKDRALIPFTTAQQRIHGNDYLGYISVKVKNTEYIDEVVTSMRRVYERLHPGHGKEFEIRTGENALAEINRILFIMKAVAGGIAGISLLVGGIGIMNIMLVSVTERTNEIGVRKALGARKNNLLWQFLIEAVVLCLFGGLLGIGLGLLFGKGIALYITGQAGMTFTSVIPVRLMIGTLLFSMLIGVAAGVYPAWRAAQYDPVEALRHE